MGNRKPYPREVRERAVRMVLDHGQEYDPQWVAICSIAEEFGTTAETLRRWVRQAEIDAGIRPGSRSAEAERIKELERENRELRRANEILKVASACFARELEPSAASRTGGATQRRLRTALLRPNSRRSPTLQSSSWRLGSLSLRGEREWLGRSGARLRPKVSYCDVLAAGSL